MHNQRPAYVIILGGTNDLGSKSPSAEILSHLIALHRVALTTVVGPEAVSNTVAVTIPPINWPSVNETSRKEVNAGLRLFAARCLHSIVVDLGNSWTAKEDLVYWSSDFVHFSEKGYDAIGSKVFDALKGWADDGKKPELLMKPKPNSDQFQHLPDEVAKALLLAVRIGSPFTEIMC